MMNTLYHFLTIAFLVVSLFISGLTVDSVSAQNTAEGVVSARRPADLLQSRYLRFGRLTSNDGLSNDQIRGIAQDNYGFMWFATFNGLNRYDGSSFKVYRHDSDDPSSLSSNTARVPIIDHSGDLWLGTWGGGLNQYDREKDAFIRYQNDPDDPHSLSNNVIRALFESRDGTIWVGTMGGLNKFDRESKQFTRYLHDPDDPNSLSHNLVISVIEDRTGVLWVATGGGLNRFDPQTEQFIHYRNDPNDSASLSNNVVRGLCEDHLGILWIATNHGVNTFNPETTRFTRYQHDPADPQTLSNNNVISVFEDQAGELWVGTWGGGLNRFDRSTTTFTHYRHDPADPYSLAADNVEKIFEGRQGILWISTDGGVSIIDGKRKPFHHYRVISDIPDSLRNNAVRALHAAPAEIVWVGTNGGGLNKFNRQTEEFTHYQHDPDDPNSLASDAVMAILEDRTGLLWVGTSGHGLNSFDPDTEHFTHYQHDAANPRSLSSDIVVYLYEDRSGTIWLCTSGGGLNAFDRETGQFTRYQHDPADPDTLSHNYVTSVVEDQAGVLWIGTHGGLNKFDRETKTFIRYQHVSTDPQSLVQDTVMSICEDRTGILWLGTAAGLDKFDRKNNQFTHYTTANGLPSDTIWGILEDEQGRLWISTPNGLSRFDPRTESFRNYNVSDGLQSNSFYYYSAHSKSRSGEMFFGGVNGFNGFYPDQIVDNSAPPPVLITDFQLEHKPVPIGGDSVLQKSILETDKLVLSHRDRVFSFESAVLNYRAPEQNRYRYRMDGFEKKWNEVDSTRRFATYTNLDPGDYLFRVIGANNDGIWNEEGASIRITVTPPWWDTMWFRISMVTAAIALLTGGFRWQVSAGEARRRELENQVETMARASQMQAERDRILEVSQDMICIAGMDGYLKYLNPAWKKTLGYADEELLSRKFLDFVHPDDLPKTQREFESLAGGHQTIDFENRYTHKDGSIRYLSWIAVPHPGEERVYAFARDITKQKQAERDLEQYQQRLKAMASQLTIAEENERRRIAVGLHDHVCQSLALVNIQLDSMGKTASESTLADTLVNKIDDISSILSETLKETKQLMFDLSSPSMNAIGLSSAISAWLKTQTGNGHSLEAEFVNNISRKRRKTLQPDVRTILFRNVRELFVNVIKHARASKVSIRMEENSSSLTIVVEDDGIGFESDAVIQAGSKISGFGLFSIKELMADLGGNLKIVSEPGKGCTSTLSVPFNVNDRRERD